MTRNGCKMSNSHSCGIYMHSEYMSYIATVSFTNDQFALEVLYTTVLIPFFSFCAQLQPTHLVLIIRIGIIHIFNVKNYFWIVPGSSYYCKLGLLQASRLSVRTLIISGLVIWSNTKAPNCLVEKQSIAIQIFARAPLQQSRVGIRNVSAIFQQ